MALGIEVSPGVFIVPDRNIGRNANILARQYKVNGFEFRGRSGLNPVKETFSVTFKNRSKADIDQLVAFFQEREGTIAFSFTVPASGGGEETLQVVCEDFTQTYVTENTASSCSAKFRKVNVPTFDGVVT